jgi:acyl-CoA synthetase (AMP-forming)/AMP-acid ligase II
MSTVRPVVPDERPVSIPARALASAERLPDVEAIVDGNVRITYAELGEEIVRATQAAMAAGIQPGDRVAIWASNGHRWIIAALGVLGAGGVLVPLNTRFKGAEAADVLGVTKARILLTETEFLGHDYAAMLRTWLAENGGALPQLSEVVVLSGDAGSDTSWEEYLAAGARVAEDAARDRIGQVSGDDLADVMFTSGTTGRPKGAMATHGQILRLYEAWIEIVGLRERDRYLIVTPFFHTFGYKSGWVAAIMRGATIVSMRVFDVSALLEVVRQERIAFLPGPPTLLHDILESPGRERVDLASLRTTIIGAADVPVKLIRRLRSETTIQTIITGYGLTETNGPASMSRPGDDADTIANFSGLAMPGTELKVAGPDGGEAARGQPGEIVIRGYHVTVGYLDDPDATAAPTDADGWLHTGDLGIMDDRGYVKITGRIKDMFIVGGFNAYPAEIENLFLAHEKISEIAVVGVPDHRLGEVGAAFVVPRAEATLEPKKLIAWARDRMANYKVPRYVEICEALPRNALGKVLKADLRQRHIPSPAVHDEPDP